MPIIEFENEWHRTSLDYSLSSKTIISSKLMLINMLISSLLRRFINWKEVLQKEFTSLFVRVTQGYSNVWLHSH